MCVQTASRSWERPAVLADTAILSKHFPGIDFPGVLKAMSIHSFQPLPADLVLMGAMISIEPDDLGARFVPFVGLDASKQVLVKIPEMDGIVDWMENTALGTDMWNAASNWSESNCGARVHFAMNCGCGLVPFESHRNGAWIQWLNRFNASRRKVTGRSNIEERRDIVGTDITPPQLLMWRRIRSALEALPAIQLEKDVKAA